MPTGGSSSENKITQKTYPLPQYYMLSVIHALGTDPYYLHCHHIAQTLHRTVLCSNTRAWYRAGLSKLLPASHEQELTDFRIEIYRIGTALTITGGGKCQNIKKLLHRNGDGE